MPKYDRSGRRMGGFKIGRWLCLRQEMLHPGETFNSRISGEVRFGVLREQIQIPLHCKLLVAWAPLRWYYPSIANYVKGGVDQVGNFAAALAVQTKTYTAGSNDSYFSPALGCGTLDGGGTSKRFTFFLKNYLNVYNNHLKWPTDSKIAESGVVLSSKTSDNWNYGLPAVALESLNTRLLDNDLTGADHELTVSSNKFSLRSMAQLEERLRSETKRMYFGQQRYDVALNAIWDVDGNHEIEKIPVILDDYGAWMAGKDIWATDSAGLGAVQGVMQWPVDYRLPFPFTAPEHGLLSYWLCARSEPVYTTDFNYMESDVCFRSPYAEFMAEPGLLGVAPPYKPLKAHRGFPFSSAVETDDIVMPAGQMWRNGWNQIDHIIQNRASYMLAVQPNSTVKASRYHPNLDHAFKSQVFGHALINLRIQQQSTSKVPDYMSSAMSGT